MSYLQQLLSAHKERINRFQSIKPPQSKNNTRIIWVGPPDKRPPELMPTPPAKPPVPDKPQSFIFPFGKISIHDVMRAVANAFGVPISSIKSRSRQKDVVIIKHVTFYAARRFTAGSLAHIGRILGGFDHSTVLHGERHIAELLAKGHPRITEVVDKVKDELQTISQYRPHPKDDLIQALEAAE